MHAQNVKVSRDEERWEVEIRAELPPEALAHGRAHVLKELGKTAKISGFRTGHVPEQTLVQHYGEDAILREAAEDAVKHVLPELLASEKLNIVEAPRVAIEPPKAGSSLSFTARAPLAPEVELPDYAALAKKANSDKKPVSVSDDEHRDTITHLRRERARIAKIEAGTEPDKAAEEAQKEEEKNLPELDDEFVKTLGYENTGVFSEKVREHLTTEKELQQKSEHRAALLDALVKDARISYPAILRDYELDEMEARFSGDLSRIGKKFEDYLAEAKKTREQVREEWREAADKRAKIRILLSEIARRENIEPDEATVSHEVSRALKHYSDAKPEALHAHIAHALRNEKVLEWLETRGA